MVIPDGAAGLGNVGNARLSGPLHVVAKGEEGVAANSDAGLSGDPSLLFLRGQDLGADLKGVLPHAVGQHVLILVGGVDVNGVVPVRAADVVHELQTQHLGMLAQIPVVRLLACQTGAVDAALLACAHADGLTVLHVADGVGLGVFQSDEGHDHVDLGSLRKLLVFRDDVGQHLPVDHKVIAALLEGDAEHILVLRGGGDVVRVDLDHVVAALLLGFQNFQRLVGIAGGDDAVGYLALEVLGGGGVADVGESGPVTVGAQAVSTPGADIGAGDGRELGGVIHEVDLPVHLAQGPSYGGAGGGNVLKAGGGGQAGGGLQFLH